MNQVHHDHYEASGVRKQAEELVRSRGGLAGDDLGTMSPEDAQRLLYELRVHQIELEMQNEELRRCHLEDDAARARYFDLYDLAPVGYVTLDEQGRILEANLTAVALLGTVKSDVVRQPLGRFIVPQDQDCYYRHRKQLLATGTPQVCELRLAHEGRDTLWIRLQAAAPEDVDSEHLCRVILIDVTARRRAEEILRASEARHRIMFEASRDALMTLAPPSWRFTAGNSSSLALFGAQDQADFVSRTMWHYSPARQLDGGASAEKGARMIKTAMDEGSAFFGWSFVRASGEEFLASVLLTRIEIDGQPSLQATVRDETQVKHLEAMLGQADRLSSMGMLAAGVAHEINNPLSFVLLNAESLARDLPRVTAAAGRCASALRLQAGEAAFAEIVAGDTAALEPSMLKGVVERASEAVAGTVRINTISKALGAFSRVESVARTSVDLNFAIDCAVTMALNQIKYRARLIKNYGQVPPVWASEGKVSQVILNLLINASHAMDEAKFDSNTITIRTWAEGGDAFVEVADTGKGISAESLSRIFEPFFTTKATGLGCGLGLAICQNIVNEFGGDIRCESEVGRGTRFVVRLPIHTGAMNAEPAPAITTLAQLPTPRGRILLVDDEELILRSMGRLLGVDYDVVTAGSGEDGRAILEADESFDVILCDLMMPGMSGIDLHQWLASHNARLAEQMVFLSGGVFAPRALAYLAGVRNLQLAKPIEMNVLKQRLSELIVSGRATH
jgi:PAS domain S-box-containing protein